MQRNLLEWLDSLFRRAFKTRMLQRIVRNSSYLVSATVFAAAMGMVQNAFSFRVIGVAGAGLIAALGTFTNVLNRLTSFRIDEMVVRHIRLYEERKEHKKAAAVFKLAALLEMAGALTAFLLIWLLAPLGVRLFSDQPNTESWFVLYGSLVLVNLIFDTSDGVLQVFNRFGAKAVIDVLQSLVRVSLTILVYFTGGGLFEIILAELAGRLVRSVGVIGLAFRTARKHWGGGWWRTPLSMLSGERKDLLTFAFSTNLSATISLVAKDSEDLWVNAFLGNVVGGYYNVARSLIGLLQIPISPLPSTTYPELSRSVARGNWRNVRYVLQRGSRMALLYSLPMTAFLVFFGRWAISLYAGPDFLPAYPLLVILLLGYTVVNIFYWNRVALLALNYPIFPTVVNFIGMLVKVGLIFILADQYQAYAFAGLLSFYYLFTVGVAASRVMLDLRQRLTQDAAA